MRRGISVLEVLVVLVIVVLVVGLGLTALARHRDHALREMCKNNLRHIGQGIIAYHGTKEDKNPRLYLPPSRIADGYATWAVVIAPYMLSDHGLLKWDLERSYFAQPQEVREARVIYHLCPTRVRVDTLSLAGDLDDQGNHVPGGLGDYACVAGDGSTDWTGLKANGPFLPAGAIERKGDRIVAWKSLTNLDSLKRGASNTLLLGEKHVPTDRMGDTAAGDGTLYSGQNPASYSRVAGPGFPLATSPSAPFNSNFGSYHAGVCNFLMGDGSVRPTTIGIDQTVLGQLARRGE